MKAPLSNRPTPAGSRLRRYILNTCGYFLLGFGLIVAPLPGPGGTPLIVAGLTILATNNPWAERWRRYIISQHQSLARVLFPPNPKIRFVWDLAGAVVFAGAVTILIDSNNFWIRVVGSILVSVALLIWLTNHSRAARFLAHINRGLGRETDKIVDKGKQIKKKLDDSQA